ncbi:MAG: NFACT family protein [Defluviitaleaceae bacterium]|nr:NFACT family protein [Defluviitaleaceae bacterium]
MALDGVTIAAVVKELNSKIANGRVDKIYQPEKDEVIVNIRAQGSNHKLLLTANPSHARLCLTNEAKSNPIDAPLFCMLMRKHLSGGKVLDIEQEDFDRIIKIRIESMSEMGDLSVKTLIIEIMGKHSNIILIDHADIILGSIKYVSFDTSSVREVLPGKSYVSPPSKGKLDPTKLDELQFIQLAKSSPEKALDFLYKTYSGMSPFFASEVCFRADSDDNMSLNSKSNDKILTLFNAFSQLMNKIKDGKFDFNILLDKNKKPMEFSCISMELFAAYDKIEAESASELLEMYYKSRDSQFRMSQKTADLRKMVKLNFDRCVKKQDVYEKTLKGIENRDRLKVYGELLTANIYAIEKGMNTFTTVNFYSEDGEEITIQLDPTKTPAENAQKYFKRYTKEKRTFIALKDQMKQNKEELAYLDSVMTMISSCNDEADIEDIREELTDNGYLKKKPKRKGQKQKTSKPMHFISSDGFDIYIGKNNKQNDELTLKFAESLDIWFHTKDIPGSHVIVRTGGETPPNKTLTEAATLAAYYSKAKESSLVPVDYVIKKHVKKPNGAKPGMVIYDNHSTAYVTPTEEAVSEIVKKE